MKKLLLASTAVAGVALVASPAHAALKMDLGGYFEGYGLYADNNETSGNLHNFDFRRDNEIHVNGETTLDNGLTIGAHTELKIANTTGDSSATTTISGTGNVTFTTSSTNGSTVTITGATIASHLSATTSVDNTAGNLVDETYLYASGGWGRVNFGEEDGAAYLLQVAAPSADSNVDGLRVYVQGINTGLWDSELAGVVLSYQQADFRQTDRLTYLTPKFNGFQAGVSYAPKAGASVVGGGTADMTADDTAGDFENLWEAAARWDGEFQGVAVSLGGGYSSAATEADKATGLVGSDSLVTWNGGANVAMSGFSLGGAYKHSNNGIDTDGDTTTWVAGAGYDNGPWHAGVSYLHTHFDAGLLAGGDDAKVHRYAVGGGYTFGPGMTFRGSVDWGKFDAGSAGTDTDHRFTQVTVGTDVQF